MPDLDVPPDPHLLESLRAVGYSAEAAVADIIDNSIAAGAAAVDILSSPSGPPRISVFDDGSGMSRAEALEAMRLAARSPIDERASTDLGRFGLGLKTASLSQCRRLTVASKKGSTIAAFRWDLDHVLATGRWSLQELDADDLSGLLGWEFLDGVSAGTLVCWEELDLLGLTEGESQAHFDGTVVRTRNHCELVFHRFIGGDDAPKVQIKFNGEPLEALDPFLKSHRSTQHQSESLRTSGATLKVHSYTLPFINRLSPADKRTAFAPGSLRDSQGFYIYRAGRLVIWGTWFRLNTKTELGKLARVQVDVPNSLDHLWALDIKKSSATPPREIREALRQLAGRLIAPSKRVHVYRGRKESSVDTVIRAWELTVDRDAFRYEINRDHPALQGLVAAMPPSQLAAFDDVLEVLETTFPIVDAHNRLSQDEVSDQDNTTLEDAVARAIRLKSVMTDTHPGLDDFIGLLLSMEPYCSITGFEAAYRKAESV